jgi:8-oxo-dGTP pyrophosphatase MutT (NUDIX family)
MVIERRAVRAILLTPADEILLMRIRVIEKGECFWITPGGGIDPGETPEEALRRELREELGLEGFLMGPLVWKREHTFNWENRRICQREQYHIICMDRFEPQMYDLVEARSLDRFRWWPVADLAQSTERLTPLSLSNIVLRYLRGQPAPETLEVEVLVD